MKQGPEVGEMNGRAGDMRVILMRLALLLVLSAVYAVVAVLLSRGLDVSHTTVSVPNLPEGLDGLRIAEIADLHSSRYGEAQSVLVDAIKKFKPDLIAITGDFIDGIHPDAAPCKEMLRSLAGVAPIYRVRGNHEYYVDESSRKAFDADAAALGAVLLDNSAVVLARNGQRYLLCGMDDVTSRLESEKPDAMSHEQFAMDTASEYMSIVQKNTPEGEYPFKIMLCHQPPYWQLWRDAGYNVALCGHLHGWIVRLPGIGGLIRKPSMYFPEEDAGLYDKQGIFVYISRGLDTLISYRNIRMNNKPELALLEIKKQ
jgi:uncharacterized protein